jgi:hypothetical protein
MSLFALRDGGEDLLPLVFGAFVAASPVVSLAGDEPVFWF